MRDWFLFFTKILFFWFPIVALSDKEQTKEQMKRTHTHGLGRGIKQKERQKVVEKLIRGKKFEDLSGKKTE